MSFYPLGAFAAPFISSIIVSNNLNWRFLYYEIVIFVLIIIFLYVTITRKIKYLALEQEERISFEKIFINRNKNMLFILTTIILVIYGISETVIATWLPTFLRSERLFNVQNAALVVSLFWIGVVAGRIVVSILAGMIKGNYFILALSLIAIISTFFLIFPEKKFIILTAVVFVGLGYSGIFPLLVSSGSTIYKQGRGALLTIIFASAHLGISIAPYLTRIIMRLNMILSISLSFIFMSVLAILVIFHIIYQKKFMKV